MSFSFLGWGRDIRETFRLALPLIAAYAGNHAMGLVDTAIVGRLQPVDIAGTGMGNSLVFLVSLLGMGLLHGLDPMASQAIGAGKPAQARRHLHEALLIAVVMVLPVTALIFSSLGALPLLGIDAPTQESAYYYLLGRAPGLVFFYVYIALRGYLQAVEVIRPIFTSTLVANLFNIPTTLFLTLGDRALVTLGLPTVGFDGWGVFGASLATTLMAALQMLILFWVLRRQPDVGPVEKPKKQGFKRMFNLGYPVSLQMLAEGGMFSVGTVLMGKFGPNILGGHQVALQIASFTFSLCLGVASATAVRVGHAVGRRDKTAARTAGFAGIATGFFIMMVSATAFFLWPRAIASLFAKPAPVIQSAIGFLYFAALFQLFDGIQVVAGGALRGAGETQLSMRVNVLTHWGFAMPLAIYLSFYTSVGAPGIWYGFTTGLMLVSILLVWGFHRITLKELKPVDLEDS